MRPTGFVYALNSRMSGMSIKQLMRVSHVVFGILAVISILLVATAGGIWSILIMILLGIEVAAYIVASFPNLRIVDGSRSAVELVAKRFVEFDTKLDEVPQIRLAANRTPTHFDGDQSRFRGLGSGQFRTDEAVVAFWICQARKSQTEDSLNFTIM